MDRSIQLIKQAGCEAGLVLNPATTLDSVRHVLPSLDMLLLMSVNPGFGGQKFIPYTLDKLREARAAVDEIVAAEPGRSPIRLEIDGGVTADNIKEIAQAGADTFVAGSAIFGKGDYAAAVAAMRQQLAEA